MKIGPGRSPGKARVDVNELGAPVFGPHDPFERNGMIFRRVAALDEDDIAVDNIDIVIGHRTPSERLCQSRYSGRVSDPGLVVHIDQSE